MRRALLLAICLLLLGCAPAQAEPQNLPWKKLQPALDHLYRLTCRQSQAYQPEALKLFTALVPKLSPGRISLPNRMDMPGAGACFDIDTDLASLLRYGFNPGIPSSTIRPNSVRCARWKLRTHSGLDPSQPLWTALQEARRPILIQGLEREETTPDLSTGGYYAYDIKRSLILLPGGPRPAFLSVSVQAGASDVGRKGQIVNADTNWSYFYSEEKGLNRFGLGWVDSRLYTAFSVAAYIQTAENTVRCLCLNWIRGGWKGLNVIKSKHISKGLQRFVRGSRSILESPRLPDAGTLARWFRHLQQLPEAKLNARYREHLEGLLETSQGNGLIGDFACSIRAGDFAGKISRLAKETALYLQRLKSCLACRHGSVPGPAPFSQPHSKTSRNGHRQCSGNPPTCFSIRHGHTVADAR
jgi:hypothetical protein